MQFEGNCRKKQSIANSVGSKHTRMKVSQLRRQGWGNTSEKQSIETLFGESGIKSKHKNNSITARKSEHN